MRIIVDRGSNAGAISAYLHRQDKREKGKEEDDPVFYSNMFGRNSQERIEELRFSADLNQRVKKTYVHYKVSFPPGENPDLETKRKIVDDVLAAREHGRHCQFFAVEHYEKVEQHNVHHLHILASSIRLDGTWVDSSFEQLKLKSVERAIEEKRGLQYCPPKAAGERTNSSIRELKLREKLLSEGKKLTKDTLRQAIDQSIGDCPSMPVLIARLKVEGYSIQFHEFDDGGKGISYAIAGYAFKGRNLGDRYTFEGLHKYAGVDYQAERDDPWLRRLNHMSGEHCQVMLNECLDQPVQSLQQELTEGQPGQDTQQQTQLLEANRLVHDIWAHSRAGLPTLKEVTFAERYQIQLDPNGHLELYRMGEPVLEWLVNGYQSNGLTQVDIEQLQAWQRLAIQQLEQQRLRQARNKKRSQDMER